MTTWLDWLLFGVRDIYAAGVEKTTRPALNFIGMSVTDDAVNERLDIELTDAALSTLEQGGAATGEALVWDGAAWSPSSDFAAQNLSTLGKAAIGVDVSHVGTDDAVLMPEAVGVNWRDVTGATTYPGLKVDVSHNLYLGATNAPRPGNIAIGCTTGVAMSIAGTQRFALAAASLGLAVPTVTIGTSAAAAYLLAASGATSLTVGFVAAVGTGADLDLRGQVSSGDVGGDVTLAGAAGATAAEGGAVVISSGVRLTHTTVAVGDSPYSVVTADISIHVRTGGGAITIALPPAVPGRRITITDIDGAAGASNITVDPDGTETITSGGAGAALTMATNWQSVTLEGSNSAGSWLVVATS
uniref:Uncharacterized protein n=1 Tax=viral metagenome TaxID=1070528 RepID=A0A6M3IKY7_9ZZZZ